MRARGWPPWIIPLTVAALLPCYYLLPAGPGRFVVFAGGLLLAVGLLTLGLARRGDALRAPWRWLVAGEVVYGVTTVAWYGLPEVLGIHPGFPSALDAGYFVAYALFGCFLVSLASGVRTEGGRSGTPVAIVDAAIFSVPFVTVVWLLVIEPELAAGASGLEHAVALGYPATTMVLWVLAVRFIFVTAMKPATILIAVWIGAELVGDVIYAGASVAGTFTFSSPAFVLWLISYGALASLATAEMHPVAARHEARPKVRRAIELGMLAAVLTPIVVIPLRLELVLEGVIFLAIGGVGFALVLLRLAMTSGSLERERHLNDRLRRLAADLRRATLYDDLTGLANRARLRAAATERSLASRRALVLVDLDQFKAINDTYGHEAGDTVLRQVAERLRVAVRPEDVVARLGADEFAALLADADGEIGRVVGARFMEAMRPPVDADGRPLHVAASVGVAAGSVDDPLAELMRRADASMYDAKRIGHATRLAVYDQATHHHILDNLALASELRGALVDGSFVLYHQCIVDLASRRPVGCEALVRWQHPERGLIPPLTFIELAEENGLMPELGGWILGEACREAQRWPADEDGREPFVSVNLSIRQLQDPEFLSRFHRTVELSRLPPTRLIVEVTETAMATELGEIGPKLSALRSEGVRVFIDDFGTGYSSLGYVRDLPLDGVKLDRAFTRDLITSRQAFSLAQAVVRLLTDLDLVVVAEGVEDAASVAQLRSLGCHRAQGFYFGRPVPASEARTLFGGEREGMVTE